MLQCIDEENFLGFSYGLRPGRSQHQALDALAYAIHEKRVNWVLDADIPGCFDEIDRDWLVIFLAHRIGDYRILRWIRKWLNAGIIEDTDWSDTGRGTPQGASCHRYLRTYLYYVFDLWIHQWRGRHCKWQCIVVRICGRFRDRIRERGGRKSVP